MADDEVQGNEGESTDASHDEPSSLNKNDEDVSNPEKSEEETQHEVVQEDMNASLSDQISHVKNIERILDINLEMRVQIGMLAMKLHKILGLHPGAILEIDKNADSLLDLKIGNKIIAHGEVVTVGENLGLRIINK